jgi:hypothetical protein
MELVISGATVWGDITLVGTNTEDRAIQETITFTENTTLESVEDFKTIAASGIQMGSGWTGTITLTINGLNFSWLPTATEIMDDVGNEEVSILFRGKTTATARSLIERWRDEEQADFTLKTGWLLDGTEDFASTYSVYADRIKKALNAMVRCRCYERGRNLAFGTDNPFVDLYKDTMKYLYGVKQGSQYVGGVITQLIKPEFVVPGKDNRQVEGLDYQEGRDDIRDYAKSYTEDNVPDY